MVYSWFFFILLLTYLNPVKLSSCGEFRRLEDDYEKNVRSITKGGSYIGQLMYLLLPIYSVMRQLSPQTPQYCKTHTLNFGKILYKISLRPRGCCANCCKVDRAEDYIQIKFAFKNKQIHIEKLSRDKERGRLVELGVKRELPTVIYFHGFGSNGFEGTTGKYIINAYLKRKEEYNLLEVDWSEFTAFPWYVEGRDNTKLVAKAMADFLLFYHNTGELPLQNVHIIGLSLGAQTASQVGKMIKHVYKVPRITGLDPAFGLYSLIDKADRMCEDDADFVDVIHTDPGILGFPYSTGHADFYPNYDKVGQPGCDFNTIMSQGESLAFRLIICNHMRSLEYYAESVFNPKAFPAYKINSNNKKRIFVKNAFMGFSANKSFTMGKLYLTTNGTKPYGRTPSYEPKRSTIGL